MSSNTSSGSLQDIFGPDVISPTGEILQAPSYGYLLDKPTCIIFVVLFALTTALHLGQAVYFRMWWLIPTAVLCGIGETLGWSGRLWSAFSPLLQDPYLMQIVATIISPTPFVGAIFITFARLTKHLGAQYSRLTPRLYSRIFLTCDIISLVVQSVGGGMAASASTQSGSNLGGRIMLVGIIFQLISLIVFFCLAVEYMHGYLHDRPFNRPQAIDSVDSDLNKPNRTEWDIRVKILTAGLLLICLCIFIRSIYRLIELADGWDGRIIRTQVYFNVLDGAMIILAMYTYNICHPGYLLRPTQTFQEEHGLVPRF